MAQLRESIPTILDECRTIAVVGLSSHADRPSYGVARYMQARGYRIVPVNPTYAGTHILGEHCYATLVQAARALGETGAKIDLVDCFRRSEYMGEVVDEAIAVGARCIWMQLGVINDAAAEKARAAGLAVIVDKCIKIEHMQFM